MKVVSSTIRWLMTVPNDYQEMFVANEMRQRSAGTPPILTLASRVMIKVQCGKMWEFVFSEIMYTSLELQHKNTWQTR